MLTKDTFAQRLEEKMVEKGLADTDHQTRLLEEYREINNQDDFDYFIELYNSGKKFPTNENNLLTAYLLELVPDFDISKPCKYVQGEFPDIDVDYLPMVRDALKNSWAPMQYGADRVCNIGNYSTFGIKSSLIDMARVHGESREEILSLTTRLGLKDDEGKALTWEKALEMHKDLADYCQNHQDIADAARRLLNRNRGRGKHAGGLVIANCSIDDWVPLVIDTDGNPVSAWVEGLHDQDLQQVGLIKFDLLVITDLLRIAKCCKLIKERRGITSIAALPGQSDWSDTSYLDDPKSLELANKGLLRGVFQFDSSGIRELVKSGGVTSFEDLVAYSAMYRPGPLGVSTDLYIERKRGRQEYEIHPLLESTLRSTYGVMCYQEQVMRILNIVGKIPLKDCEIVRKAISKKKEKVFAKYKTMFVENGQQVLSWKEDQVVELWNSIMQFAGYGFNKSHAVAYTYISARLLYLKAHFPLEFFAAALSCEGDDKKIKEYKLEAERNGIIVNRVDLNKSKSNFSIVEDESKIRDGKPDLDAGQIYIGFSNIKGIGKEVADEIVANQPYESFEDFLARFGQDAKVLKPLIALRCFNGDGLAMFEFYEFYKKEVKRRESRTLRHEETKKNLLAEIEALLLPSIRIDPITFCQQTKDMPIGAFTKKIQEQASEFDAAHCKLIHKAVVKYNRSVEQYLQKTAEDKPISFDNFEPTGQIDDKIKEILQDVPQAAESLYYGFGWSHPIEKSPDYDGDRTFSQFEIEEDLIVAQVEVQIIEKPKVKQSKKGNSYYLVKVEDADWNQELVTIWDNDYEIFKEEFEYWESDSRKGLFLKIRVQRPGPGFKSYTFDSPPKHLRHKLVPRDKAADARLIKMRR